MRRAGCGRGPTRRRGAALERDALLNAGRCTLSARAVDAERYLQAQRLCPAVWRTPLSIRPARCRTQGSMPPRDVGDAAGVLEQKRRTGHGVSDDCPAPTSISRCASAAPRRRRSPLSPRACRQDNADACAEALSQLPTPRNEADSTPLKRSGPRGCVRPSAPRTLPELGDRGRGQTRTRRGSIPTW